MTGPAVSPPKGGRLFAALTGLGLAFLILNGGLWLIYSRTPPPPGLEDIHQRYSGERCSRLDPAPGDTFANHKQPVPDILILGDSVSMAWEKAAWPWETARQLKEAASLSRTPAVTVLARPGRSSSGRLAAWREWVKARRGTDAARWPQVVIWQITMNDLLDEVTVFLNGRETRITGVCRDRASVCKQALFGTPVRGILSWYQHRRAWSDTIVSLEQSLRESRGLKDSRAALKAFAREISHTPAQGVFVTVPYLWNTPSPFEPVTREAQALAVSSGLSTVNLSPIIEQVPLEQTRCRPSDYVHPSLSAQKLMAAEIAGELSKLNWEP